MTDAGFRNGPWKDEKYKKVRINLSSIGNKIMKDEVALLDAGHRAWFYN